MYRESYQRGMLTIFFSVGSKPLAYWETHTQNGYISRFLDHDIKSMVLEIGGTNVSTTYMICPKGKMVLGITMPFLVMVVKNLNKYFSFEVTILDETGTRRRFRVSNFQSTTQVLPLCTVMPIGLSEGWNQIQFNLAEFTRRAYKKQFIEVQKLKINANIRLRRIYFTERILPEDQLPAEYKLYFPLKQKQAKGTDKKTIEATPEKEITPAENILEERKDHKSLPKIPGSKLSMHSIKRPSQDRHDTDRISKVLDVKEDELDRARAVTTVIPADDDKIEGVEREQYAETEEGAVTEKVAATVEGAVTTEGSQTTEVAETAVDAVIPAGTVTPEDALTPEGAVTPEGAMTPEGAVPSAKPSDEESNDEFDEE